MQVIGFNFTKISAERFPNYKFSRPTQNIGFTDVSTEKVALLPNSNATKITFNFSLDYKESEKAKDNLAQIGFEGHILLSAEKEESKEIQKQWKKKKLPQDLAFKLSNLILKKCSIKAMQLQEDIVIPSHLPIPQLTPQKQE